MAEAGLIAGADGNITVRIAPDRILVTPSGLIKAELEADDIVEVDPTGRKVRGHRRPTSELDMHLRVLRQRPDVMAVVHAHPPIATGFGVAELPFDECVLPELIFQVGHVPLVPYGTPGTPELGDMLDPYIHQYDAVILANHGAVTVGATLQDARIRMESLEHAAKIILTARLLGRVHPLERAKVEQLEALRRSKGLPGVYPGCPAPQTEE
jgi:L-fuculose-phosphate aldolase